MPDPTKQTISATQTPALFDASPWVTRWMLWQHFANGVEIDPPEDGRMSWGRKLQPLIVEQAAEDLHLECRPNDAHVYQRAGMVGCTRDATIICPDRGPGALETKCVFDYRTWMEHWEGGKKVPRHYEIQLQQQMMVGDGKGAFDWGVLAAWVAGDVHYFERKPIYELWNRIGDEARSFFASVEEKNEPDPFGVAIELPWLNALFTTTPGVVVDISGEEKGDQYGEIARQYAAAKEQESAGARTAGPLRAKLLALAKDAEAILLPSGLSVRISKHGKGKRLTVYDPQQQKIINPLMAG